MRDRRGWDIGALETWIRANRKEALRVFQIADEYRRRRRHPSRTYRPSSHPERNQLAFHQSTALTRLVYGGNQSGKSRCAAQEAVWWLTGTHPYQATPPNPRIYVVSAEYRTIMEGVYKHLMGSVEGAIEPVLPYWNVSKVGPRVQGYDVCSSITCRTEQGGIARIDFISGHGSEGARKKAQAAEVDLLIVDEEISQDMWTELTVRRLTRGGKVVVSLTGVTSPPWVTDLEDRALSGDKNVHIVRLSTERAMLQGIINRQVFDEIFATLPDEERQVRIYGHTRKSRYLVYPEFSAKHVVDAFDIPPEWKRYMAIDPGWRTCAALWLAVAPGGEHYVYRELYAHQETYHTIAARILSSEGWVFHEDTQRWIRGENTERIEFRLIDPAAFGNYETGELRLGNLLVRDYDIATLPAQNNVEAGIELVRRRLMDGQDGVPQLRFFATCANTFREIRGYRRQRDTSDAMRNQRADRPVKRDDHAMDCLRYLESSYLEAPRKKQSYYEAAMSNDDFGIPAFMQQRPSGAQEFERWRKRRRDSVETSMFGHVGMGSER